MNSSHKSEPKHNYGHRVSARSLVLVSSLVIVAVLVVFRTTISDTPPQPIAATSSEQLPQQQAPQSKGHQQTGSPGIDFVAEYKRGLYRRREALAEELHHTTSIADYLNAHLKEAQDGDSDAQFAVFQALTACAQYQAGDSGKVQFVGYRRVRSTRVGTQYHLCDDLPPTTVLGAPSDWLEKSAAQGNGVAMLKLATPGPFEPQLSVSDRIDLLHQAVSSLDPDALAQFALAAMYTDHDMSATPDTDTQTKLYAVELLRCDLGADCSSTGLWAQLHCDVGITCATEDGIMRWLLMTVPPWQYESAAGYADELIKNARSGRYDWPEITAIESQIRGTQQPS